MHDKLLALSLTLTLTLALTLTLTLTLTPDPNPNPNLGQVHDKLQATKAVMSDSIEKVLAACVT